jgi:hypothetical protein
MADAQFLQPLGTYSAISNAPLGHEVDAGYGRRYRYVKFIDAVTYVIGHVVQMATTYGFVTNDVDGTILGSTGLRFAGAIPNKDLAGNTLTAVPAQNDFGYIQTAGLHTAIKTDGGDDITAGDTIIMKATDGVIDSVAAATSTGTLLYVGIAQADDVDAADTVSVNLKSPLW